MNPYRLAWLFGIVACAALTLRLVGRTPASSVDAEFNQIISLLQREIGDNYVETIDPQRLREAAIEGMMSVLDEHSLYAPPRLHDDLIQAIDGTFVGIGVNFLVNPQGQIQVRTPLEDSPALRAGVEAGDVFVEIDGNPVEHLDLTRQEKEKRLTSLVKGPAGTEVKITFRRLSGEVYQCTIRRAAVVSPPLAGVQRSGDNSWDWFLDADRSIAYVRVSQFSGDLAIKLRQVIEPLYAQGMRGLVVDLRFNGGGRLEEAIDIADLFLDNGLIVSTRGRARPERRDYARAGDTLPDVPLVILVNEESASASEVLAGALQDNRRATVVGERTFGKGSVQELQELPDHDILKLTVAYYYLPSGRLVHRRDGSAEWGVEPSIVVPMDPEAEFKLAQSWAEQEIIRPTSAPTTKWSLVDPQLDAAVDTIRALLIAAEPKK
jgi:carboxyl-terminal processing protease